LDERAYQEFKTALQLSSAIDDVDGTVAALLNLARMARRAGALTVAEDYLQRASTKVPEVPGRKGDLAIEKSLLLIAQQRLEEAKVWAERAVALSVADNRAACLNLLARVQWQRGDVGGAEACARKALLALGGAGGRVEAANAHRLLGEIAMAAGRDEEAGRSFNDALALDKEAGLSSRIAGDLRFLARLASRAARDQDAERYLYRAFEVSLNSGDPQGAANDLALLADISRKSGDFERAEALDGQRRELLGGDEDEVSP
jgi:tetratricopeptide (TPR) repeat protein